MEQTVIIRFPATFQVANIIDWANRNRRDQQIELETPYPATVRVLERSSFYEPTVAKGDLSSTAETPFCAMRSR